MDITRGKSLPIRMEKGQRTVFAVKLDNELVGRLIGHARSKAQLTLDLTKQSESVRPIPSDGLFLASLSGWASVSIEYGW